MATNPCNAADAVIFAQRYRSESGFIARQLQVPVENILGLAAEESEYGRGRIATEYNNYFSMHAPAPGQLRAEPARKDPRVKLAVYGSFAQSAQSFAIKFGAAVRGKTDPKAFAAALVRVGYNPGSNTQGGRDGFADYLARIIEQTRIRMACRTR